MIDLLTRVTKFWLPWQEKARQSIPWLGEISDGRCYRLIPWVEPSSDEAGVRAIFHRDIAEIFFAIPRLQRWRFMNRNAEGRFTRALPMFLAEQVHLQTRARALFVTPWMKQGGFVVSGKPWDTAQTGGNAQDAPYLVSLHLIARQNQWKAQFILTRLIDNSSLATWEEVINPNDSAMAIQRLLTMTLKHLHDQAGIEMRPMSEWLFPPSNKWLPTYMVCLEQALAVSCSKLVDDDKPFLSAERSIFENHLNLSLEEPNNICCRFLLLSTMEKEASRQPKIAGEFKDRIERLQHEKPLVEPAQALADAALSRIFKASS